MMSATQPVRTSVAVLGGGLAGIYAATLLHSEAIDFRLIETRDRLGGRILSVDETGRASDDGFDLGPSWFWPDAQPQFAALVKNLGLTSFAQNNAGDVIFDRMSREAPARYRPASQAAQSMRIVGGTAALVRALTAQLPDGCVELNSCAKSLTLAEDGIVLKIGIHELAECTIVADQVIAAIPPRLLAALHFTPEIDSTAILRWRETGTWMAPHAKFFAFYDLPFWRDAGLSGTAQSFVGPLVEIHDATTASGKAALLGFVGIPSDQRSVMGELSVGEGCVAQFVRIFGPQARHPRATLLKDWAADPYTATPEDRAPSGHPTASRDSWVTGAWQNRLSLAASETSEIEPGYLAGAIAAAQRAVSETLKRMSGNR